jgi:Carboxypeptidase regulatory-like domain
MLHLRTLGIAPLLAAVMAGGVAGQSISGTITGTVTDASSVVVEGANVMAITNPPAGTYRAVSDKNGRYTLAGLPPGTYDIQATATAMQAFTQKGVAVKTGPPVDLNIRMDFNGQLGTLGEDRVTAAADAKRHHPPAGPTPRTPDGKPDLSGVWWSPRTTDTGRPEFLPAAEAVAKVRLDNNRKDSPQSRCLPSNVLRFGPLFELVQSKQFLVIINDDDYPGFHQVYLDGRPHPPDPYAWYGHNTGRWDGDTLVIDRVGFKDEVWLDQELHPHTDKLHVVDRYRRPDLGHLTIETTVEDPGVVTKPYTIKRSADLAPDQEIDEFICNENNQDVEHLVGK